MTTERRVLIAPKEFSDKQLKRLQLPHPRNNELYSYYADTQSETLAEVVRVNMKGKRSWAGSNWVLSDGSLLMLTPIDPLFIYLSLITKISLTGDDEWRFVDIEAIGLETYENMDADSLRTFLSMKKSMEKALVTLCEVKQITDDVRVAKIDRGKTIAWLRRKCDASRLPKDFNIGANDTADDAELLEQTRTREMVLLISEYLPQYWMEQLMAEFGGFAKVHASEQMAAKRVKEAVFDAPETYTQGVAAPSLTDKPVKQEKPKTAREKQLEKAARNSKPITNFFKKKTA
ncbi:hypothetical protein H4R20_002333 [Coemansia guatemalensis]|uniref:Rnh202 triple barrel domain-containing protein n=1 Tax=Coemansia guatemalensis TaxID=2761395 RepID=A0A9W8HVC3_9FUNG|nr:hypothetical protein H4R20_002333 [Coemansia guatemalensis]